MRMTAAFQSDLNLFDQLLTVQLLPPSRLAVAAPCCSRLQCFSSSFCFFFCLSSRGNGCCPQRCPDHSPQPSHCLLSLLQPARHIQKKKRKKKNPPFPPRSSVLSAMHRVFLVVSGWSHFSLPRVVAMLPGANLLPPHPPHPDSSVCTTDKGSAQAPPPPHLPPPRPPLAPPV